MREIAKVQICRHSNTVFFTCNVYLLFFLIKVALQYLSAPISSVASEREFKSARNISHGPRSHLLPENLRRLLFLKHNLPAVGFNTMNLKCVNDESKNASSAFDEDELNNVSSTTIGSEISDGDSD